MPFRDQAKQNEFQKQRHRRNVDFVRDLKKKPCTDCGIAYHPAAMQWDHLGNKFKPVSKMTQYSKERLLKEISKCELVCANCHAVRTYNRIAKFGRPKRSTSH